MVSAQLDEVSHLITQKLGNMVEAADSNLIWSRRKAISALFPYAVFLEQHGQQGMLDLFSHAARATSSGTFMWYHIKPFTVALFDKPNPPSLKWVLKLVSPHVPWHDEPQDRSITTWQAASTSYKGVIDQNVVNELLHVAFIASLQSHLPRGDLGKSKQIEGEVICQVQALGDIGILKSYLLLVWLEWDRVGGQSGGGISEMKIAIQKDLCGIGMGHHWEDLIKQLDHILMQLDSLWQYLAAGLQRPGDWRSRQCTLGDMQSAKERYSELKRVLLEVDSEAVRILTRMASPKADPSWSTDTGKHIQDLTQPLPVPCLSHIHKFGTI